MGWSFNKAAARHGFARGEVRVIGTLPGRHGVQHVATRVMVWRGTRGEALRGLREHVDREQKATAA